MHGEREWILVDGFLEHRCAGRRVFGFFHTLLLDPAEVDRALSMIDQQEYPGNDFFPRLATIRDVLAGEVPWSARFRSPPEEGRLPLVLARHWQDEDGIAVGQVAVDLEPVERRGPTALSRSYLVPSHEFAAAFALRQLPGTLDLVSLDGERASATYSVAEPWTGNLLYVRRDLLVRYAGDRVAVQVAWGERMPAVAWHSPPSWVTNAYQAHQQVWRERQVLDAGDAGGTVAG